MPYEQYTVEDFTLDESFRQWVQEPTPINTHFWKTWLAQHPEKAEALEEARTILLSMQFPEQKMPHDVTEQIWSSLQAAMDQSTLAHRRRNWGRLLPNSYVRGVAAVFIGLLLFSAAYFFLHTTTNSYTTAYGETQRVTLPDGSVVVLNANSTLRFPSDWEADEAREVWLEGEAYFSVTHQKNHQKFVVRSGNPFDIEVVGTEFNVTSRQSRTSVVLNSGKVKLHIRSEADPAKAQETVIMQPGEIVEFKEHSRQYVKRKVNTAVYSSWKSKKLVLDNTSLHSIVTMLKETYGLQIRVADTTLLSQKVSGSIPIGTVDVLLSQLAATFEIHIAKENNLVNISPIRK